MPSETISGSLLALFLYDAADEIRLDEVRRALKAPPAGRKPAFRQPAPQYVQFASPPVIETLEGMALDGGRWSSGQIGYYDYGVVSLKLEMPFAGSWPDLVALSARWMNEPELERRSQELLQSHLRRVSPALVNPYHETLSEDYFIIRIDASTADAVPASYLIEHCGDAIAQIVRGESARFSSAERAEILESRMSYYEGDLLVVGWSAALIYDTPEGAAPTIQLLEYANTQLLEFRHYDGVLTGLLAAVYRLLERRGGFFARWRLAREAERVNAIRLDVRELTERVDNSIKFLSDMFAARLYRMAAARIGVPDYRRLVDEKLQSAGELYSSMMDRYHAGRAFILELMVVVILIIELVFLFRGIK
ncbi:MAG TPA: hypothetical protein VGF59_07845 [Bryobacteraceae bacterium]